MCIEPDVAQCCTTVIIGTNDHVRSPCLITLAGKRSRADSDWMPMGHDLNFSQNCVWSGPALVKSALRRVSIMAVAALAMVVPAASATPCQKSLAPSPIAGRDGYFERDGGQRCEGIYVSAVAGESVQLVSLSQGHLSYDLAHPSTLLITLAKPAPNLSGIHVRAVGIPERLYYQMDADMPAGHPLVWPIQDVLLRQQIVSTDIGVFAFHASAGATTVFLPVSIAAASASSVPAEPLIVVFRVGAVVSPRWRFVSTSGAVSAFAPARIDDNRITLTLPAELRLPGRLELSWDEAGSGKSHVTSFSIGD
jgi:hypothetical protein